MRRTALAARVILVAILAAPQGCTEIPTAHDPEVEASFARSTSEISVGPTVVNPGGQVTVHAPRGVLQEGDVLWLYSSEWYTLSLRMNQSSPTAHAKLPPGALCGVYQAEVREPDGTRRHAGDLTVRLKAPGNVKVSPGAGAAGSTITITDTKGRIQAGDGVGFGFVVDGHCVSPDFTRWTPGLVSADGSSLTAEVQDVSWLPTTEILLWVGPSGPGDWRFGGLPFEFLPPA